MDFIATAGLSFWATVGCESLWSAGAVPCSGALNRRLSQRIPGLQDRDRALRIRAMLGIYCMKLGDELVQLSFRGRYEVPAFCSLLKMDVQRFSSSISLNQFGTGRAT